MCRIEQSIFEQSKMIAKKNIILFMKFIKVIIGLIIIYIFVFTKHPSGIGDLYESEINNGIIDTINYP